MLAGVLLGALSSCQVKSLDTVVFKCATDTECGSGFKCVEGLCRSPSATSSGTCATTCSSTRQLCCGTACVDPATDSRNCGACGRACGLAEICAAGVCVKESCDNAKDDNLDGLVDCQDGIACPTGTACRSGSCCQGECRQETGSELCSDGQDNDCDGLTDCGDPGCLGQRCGESGICLAAGACAVGCFIDGQARLPGVAREGSPCFACVVGVSTSAWSPVARGQASGSCSDSRRCDGAGGCRAANGQRCGGGTDCASGNCAADGVCRP